MKSNDLKKSVRVQMGAGTESYLMQLAEKHRCFHGDKASISKLLDYIARGYLEVSETTSIDGNPTIDRQSDEIVVKIKIKAQFRDLSGVIHVIVSSISSKNGNILDIESIDDNSQWITYHFLISISLENLEKLLNKLYLLKIRDIKAYNDDFILQKQVIFTSAIQTISEYENYKLFSDIRCTIALKLVTANKKGVFAKITNKIATCRALVESVEQHFNSVENNNSVKLFLEVVPQSQDDVFDQLRKIHEIHRILSDTKSIPGLLKPIEYIVNVREYDRK